MEKTNWEQMFHIVDKVQGHFIIVKNGDNWSYNMKCYVERRHAVSAVSNIYRGIQRRIEKALLG